MKGLIKYNLYYSKSTLIALILAVLSLSFIAILLPLFFNIEEPSILYIVPLFFPILFAMLNAIGFRNRTRDSFGKIELSLPVNRKDVIKSLYLTDIFCYTIYILYHLFYAILIGALYGFNDIFSALSITSLFAVTVFLFISAFTRVVCICLKPEMAEIVVTISIVVIPNLLNFVNSLNAKPFYLTYGILAISSLIFYILSYFISVSIYNKKDIT